MKFGKLLQSSTKDMPGMGTMFLRYKELKKQLKNMTGSNTCSKTHTKDGRKKGAEAPLPSQRTLQASKFLKTLNEDLSRFNNFYMEAEEDCVIKLQALSQRLQSRPGAGELQLLTAELVELHGEMVLLLHWSLLNYAAVMKILKKHDKCTGLAPIKGPYQPIVLQQPFSSTSIISGLVKEAEAMLQKLVGPSTPAGPPPPPVGWSSPLEPLPTASEPSSPTDPPTEAKGSPCPPHAAPAAASPSPPSHPCTSEGNLARLRISLQRLEQRAATEGMAASAELDEQPGSRTEQNGTSAEERSASVPGTVPELAMGVLMSLTCRRTQSALDMWECMTQTASTPSTVLPAQRLSQLLPAKRAAFSTTSLRLEEDAHLRVQKRQCILMGADRSVSPPVAC